MANFVVYRSSAGSGKTFTLVREFLRLSLSDPSKLHYNFKRILAVTFTNKAAAEMKNRVIDYLQQLAEENTPFKIQELLCGDLKIKPEELKKRSKILLSHILHNYSDFAIGTIDSFTHKLVKTFAHDLKLPVNFNIELNVQGFYEKVVANLISEIGQDAHTSKLLKEYVLSKAEENSAWDPEQLIIEFSKLLQKEQSLNHVETLNKLDTSYLENARKQIAKIKSDYYAFLQNESAKALALLAKNNLTDEDFVGKSKGPQNFFYKASKKKLNKEDTEKSTILSALAENKWLSTKTAIANSIEINKELTALAFTIKNYIDEHFELFSLCNLLDKQIYPLLLLKKIEELSRTKKEEERLVFLSEFNNKIFEIINNEPTPFIYERLGEKYQHYLLDEFQDTSSLQWYNILPLIDNSLSNGWFNLIVGDGKQSIYRWRNANVKQFSDLPLLTSEKNQVQQERENNLTRNFTEIALNSNYRSLPTIVDFNNLLFETLSSGLLEDTNLKIYKDQRQLPIEKNGGYVSLSTGIVESSELEDRNYTSILSSVSSAIADSFMYKDICVLCRNNKEAHLVANFLIQNKLPVVSSESLLIKHNLEVQVLVAFLNYLLNPDDTIHGAVVVNYLFQTKRIDASLCNQLLLDLSTKKTLFTILNELGFETREKDFPLKNLLNTCIHVVNILELNKKAALYIRFFLDEVAEFLQKEHSNIASFLEWWKTRREKASVVIPRETNAIQIMTIHSSKGLEFPVVIVPFCNWKIFRAQEDWVELNHKDVNLPVAVIQLSKLAGQSGLEKEFIKEQQNQILDNLNLLYVALTRAIERLHIIAISTKHKQTNTVSEWLSSFAEKHLKMSEPHIYEAGEPGKKQSRETKIAQLAFPLNPLAFENTEKQFEIKSSRLFNGAVAEDAKKYGILMHWLLSQIKLPHDIPTALSNGVSRGYFTEEESPNFRKSIASIIEHPQLKGYFTNESTYLERELITQKGELLRPDRIVVENNTTTLIDYKTGKQNTEKYSVQLQKYEEALRDLGHSSIKKILVYLEGPIVVELN